MLNGRFLKTIQTVSHPTIEKRNLILYAIKPLKMMDQWIGKCTDQNMSSSRHTSFLIQNHTHICPYICYTCT